MPQPTTASPETLAQNAQAFERAVRSAEPVIARRALYWASLRATAARLNVDPRALLGELAARNDEASRRAAIWGRAITALDSGSAELVPWQRPGEAIRWAVVAAASPLGWWALAARVVQVAAGALFTGAGLYLADAWGATRQTEADAKLLDSQTRAELVKIGKNDPQVARTMAEAMAAADQAAAGADRSWLDQITGAAGKAAIGISSGAVITLGVLWALSRNKGRRTARARA